ncbi:hypothetical protein [Anaerovibrio sp. RM50]|uniref:putative antirestriction adenine methyltransferase n=1 Tax=Anaerovibrio sp. RM50 TaxID=1200557 RepID=UPI0004806F5E|nr:hypothetical protein [Anaerovibrio sp. RM50]
MPMFQNPAAFFLGTLVPSEQKFLKVLLENARKNGYTKFVEPCAGAFAMSHLAVQSGYKPAQIEASDVSMFTSIMGYAITGKDLSELQIKATGFTDEEMCDPATALYAWKYLSTVKDAGKAYFYNFMIDLKERREEHIATIREQLDRAKSILGGMSYRALDMWKHMDEVLDDEHCIVIANPPTYTAGFEKYYDTSGNMTWKEPEYGIFNPATGLQEFMDLCKNAKCLVLCYEENSPGLTAGSPVFARYGVRNGINVYLTSNRPDEAAMLANGKKIARPNEGKMEPLECSMLPRDYVITEKSEVKVFPMERMNAQYYRKLWTHNFVGSSAPINMGVLIDGKIAGVFGVDKSALTMGAFGTRVSDSLFLMYGMTVPHKTYRLGRLITMLAQNKKFVMGICNDLEKEKVGSLKTVQMTKYPEAKEMRGIMKLEVRKPDDRMGFRLTYKAELKDRDEKETLVEWLRRENKWQKERAKAKSTMKK